MYDNNVTNESLRKQQVDMLNRYEDICKPLPGMSTNFVDICKPLPGMSTNFVDICKPLPGMSNKIHELFKHFEIIRRDSPLAELTNRSNQKSDHLHNPIPELPPKSIFHTISSLNFPNIIIPRPTDNSIFPLVPEGRRNPSLETDSTTITHEVPDKKRIFIGHGHSGCWGVLRDFITSDLGLFYDEFDRVSTPSLQISERLQQMLEEAEMAFLIMTAQNEYTDGTLHASNNVIHEIGLFQGKLGFKKAIILLEEGCAEFSNIHGLIQIRFPKGNIEAVFEMIRQVLEREGII